MTDIEQRKIGFLPVSFLGADENPFVLPSNAPGCDNPLLPTTNKVIVKNYLRDVAPQFVSWIEKKFHLRKRGGLLDVGISGEYPLLQAFKGFRINGLSLKKHPDRYSPKIIEEAGAMYDGDIVLADDPESALHDKKFGTVLFWGSWDTAGAGAENRMIGNTIYLREMAKSADGSISMDDIKTLVSQERDTIISVCSRLLNPGGVIWVVSARYSFDGGGFDFSEFDHEMIGFLDALRRGFEAGAKKVHIIGRTREEMKRDLAADIKKKESGPFPNNFSLTREKTLTERMNQPLVFPDEVADSFLTRQDVSKALEVWEGLQNNNRIGYIDSVLMEF